MIFFIDNDSTLMKEETFDELFRLFGNDVYDQVLAKTHASMEGSCLSLESSLQFRIDALLRQPIKITKSMIELFAKENYHFSEGVECFLQSIIAQFGSLKNRVFILSGGFYECIIPKLQMLDISHSEKEILISQLVANRFLWNEYTELIGIDWKNSIMWQPNAKRRYIESIQSILPIKEQWVAIGDGSNDIGMIQNIQEGVFYAFTGNVYREKTVMAAKGRILNTFLEIPLE